MAKTYTDKDGLTYSKHIRTDGNKLLIGDQEIFIKPDIKQVFKYLISNDKLWNASRISVTDQKWHIGGRAPIFGIPFSHGLQEALKIKKMHLKALYQRSDWKLIKGHAVVGTLAAHTASTKDSVDFEAWQLLDITSETFYIHAIISKKNGLLHHLDGATMHHSPFEKNQICKHGSKIKGAEYTKHFRIDGEFPIQIAKDIMELYLPLDDLTEEFLHSIS